MTKLIFGLNGLNVEITKEVMRPDTLSGLENGLLTLPDEIGLVGAQGANDENIQLILFGENETYLHCVVVPHGTYLGVFKSSDPDHMYQHILNSNKRSKAAGGR